MGVKRVYYGGQAVIEGVMMRGQKAMVTAVRRPNGEITVNAQNLPTFYTGQLRKTPFIRGIVVLVETMYLGVKTLLFSANVSLEEEDKKISGGYAGIMVAVVFAIALFFIAPLFLTRLFNTHIPSALAFNLIDGLIRLAIFIIYLKLTSLLPDIKRVFAYHGAEHMAVNTFENNVPLEVAEARKYSTAHSRCGTSFLFAVMVIAIIVFSLVGRPSFGIMVLARIVLVPVIASLSYELTQFTARHIENKLARVLLTPGLWLQSLTTRQPDDSQLEVALTALKHVVEIDQAEVGTIAGTTAQTAA
jgi:uncharacterized protein YqhQ